MKVRWILIGVLVVVGVSALLAIFTAPDEPVVETPVHEITVTGQTLPPFTDPLQDTAMGTPAPTVAGTDLDGQPFLIQPGKPQVVMFLAHWCPHCQAEVPRVEAYFREGGTAGVELLTVATSNRPDQPNYPAEAWLEREGWSNPVLMDDDEGTVAQAFGLTSFPFFVVIDPNGSVVLRVAGELDRPAIEQLFALALSS